MVEGKTTIDRGEGNRVPDRATAEKCWDELCLRLPGFFFRLGACGIDLEDLIQETAFRIFKNLNSLNCEADFSKWGFGIAKNILYQHYQEKTMDRKKQEKVDGYFLLKQAGGFEKHLLTSIDLDSNLAALTDSEHEILTLKLLEGYTLIEIGEKCGLDKSKVDRILKKTLEKLRERVSIAE